MAIMVAFLLLPCMLKHFLNDNIPAIIDTALKSIPAESDYAAIVRDVITLHEHYPADWRKAWSELEAKWGDVDICGAGGTFNIDAKLNGAYIVMGLLYGEGDPHKNTGNLHPLRPGFGLQSFECNVGAGRDQGIQQSAGGNEERDQ